MQMSRNRATSLTGLSVDTRRRSSTKQPGEIFLDRTKMWSNTVGKSVGLIPGRTIFGPIFLITVSPIFVIIVHHTLADLRNHFRKLRDSWHSFRGKNLYGSLALFWTNARTEGIFSYVYSIWPSCRDPYTWKTIGIFMTLQLTFLKLVPGKNYKGPTTPSGCVPEYTVNGVQSYFLSIFLFVFGAYFRLYTGGVLYDYLGNILSCMNVFGLVFCAILYLKGLFLPSSSDHGSTGNPVFDYYWGTELYPRIFGWDVKQFTNCRCGMMFWGLYLVSCLYKQYELYEEISESLLVNVAIQLIYITKFFWWESGYLSTIDIMHDRAGFYICWGCLVYLPAIYTSHSTFLVQNPSELGWPLALLMFAGGALCIYLNYDADMQRQRFRGSGGNLKIWGKDPVFIEAKYKTEKGETKTGLLLASGWWGRSRHFHYIPEIGAAILWTIPVWCGQILPYFYIPYLVLLLTDRAFRDDARCRSKYQKYWDQYCRHVPFMILPGVF